MYTPRTYTGYAAAVFGAELSGTGLRSGSGIHRLKRPTRVVASWNPVRLFVQRRLPLSHADCITCEEQSYLPSRSIYTELQYHHIPQAESQPHDKHCDLNRTTVVVEPCQLTSKAERVFQVRLMTPLIYIWQRKRHLGGVESDFSSAPNLNSTTRVVVS